MYKKIEYIQNISVYYICYFCCCF